MNIPVLSLLPGEISSCCGCTSQYTVEETSALHTHNFFEFFYVFGGRAIHNINNVHQPVTEGTLVLIRPADRHEYYPIENNRFHIVSLGFMPDEFHKLQEWTELDLRFILDRPMPPFVILHGYERAYVENLLQKIHGTNFGNERRQCFHSFFPLLCYIIRNKNAEEANICPPWLSKLVKQMGIKDNFIQGLPKLYSLCDYSTEYITRSFQKFLHITPTELINSNRIHYASEQLQKTDKKVIEICYESGFNNLGYFYTQFKKYNGCTPKEFMESAKFKDE